jgi:hypothetical protein
MDTPEHATKSDFPASSLPTDKPVVTAVGVSHTLENRSIAELLRARLAEDSKAIGLVEGSLLLGRILTRGY